ncbi:MAG: pyrroline-5-carboxylate reductase [Erysipelotrichales bacterium]|nr:pyrroline-5-carboxylate reductase [Erysipelotrichales bacterium]
MKIGFIGCGNMGKAIVEGVLDHDFSEEIVIYDHHLNEDSLWVKQTGVKIATSERQIATDCDYIILAIKPYQIVDVLRNINSCIDESKVIVSLAAGFTIDDISRYVLLKQPIIRIMPNTAAIVGESMSAIMINKYVSEEVIKFTLDFCEKFGKAELISESQIHAFIGLSGSSPAYFYEMLEALGMAGVHQGLKAEAAYRYAAQAMLGAAKTYLETQVHPSILRDQVCSPSGTTIEAVNILEREGFKGIVMDAAIECSEKSKRMK